MTSKEKIMSVSNTVGYRFCDLTLEEQDLISAIKQSEICLERWDLDEYDCEFHRNIIRNCTRRLKDLWYPQSATH